jgi:hypothetical protein
VQVPAAPIDLPTTTESICARLLSGDANADGKADDLNQNGKPDYEELREALLGGGGGRSLPSPIGLPAISPAASK